jgi:AraC family transcriptional regulator
LAKIAHELELALERRRIHGGPGRTASRVLASGDGWTVADVVCTSGPLDRPFEEEHGQYSIAIVLDGTFQYRSEAGRALMTAGSLLLGHPGQRFECGHEHAEGDRCVSFWYSPEYFERVRADAAGRRAERTFGVPRIPPLRPLTPAVTTARLGLREPGAVAWEELGLEVASRAVSLAAGVAAGYDPPPNAEARVTRIVRLIDSEPEAQHALGSLAREGRLSPYHFLRTFQRVTGVTPHQYVLRARLRAAALRLAARRQRILDVALDCGFGDLSNFNRTFRAEFGMSPRAYRRRSA